MTKAVSAKEQREKLHKSAAAAIVAAAKSLQEALALANMLELNVSMNSRYDVNCIRWTDGRFRSHMVWFKPAGDGGRDG